MAPEKNDRHSICRENTCSNDGGKQRYGDGNVTGVEIITWLISKLTSRIWRIFAERVKQKFEYYIFVFSTETQMYLGLLFFGDSKFDDRSITHVMWMNSYISINWMKAEAGSQNLEQRSVMRFPICKAHSNTVITKKHD